MKRQRGRNNGRKPHMPVRPQTFDSSGPDVRIRGNAYQVLEKYLQLARDATAVGDRIAAENFYQHAEHYYRTINANNEQQQQRFQHGQGHPQAPQHGPVVHHDHEQRSAPVHEPQPPHDPGAGPQPSITGPDGGNPGDNTTG